MLLPVLIPTMGPRGICRSACVRVTSFYSALEARATGRLCGGAAVEGLVEGGSNDSQRAQMSALKRITGSTRTSRHGHLDRREFRVTTQPEASLHPAEK